MATVVAEGVASSNRRQRVTAPVLVAAAVMVASVVLHLRDPHRTGSYLFCPWLLLTGTYCPGCGGLRAVHDLSNGDIASAASSNVLFVGSVPLLVVLWSRWFVDRWRGVRRVVDDRRGLVGASAFGVVALVFWVARNLPGLEWLTP
jgi:Protein of unknown function (DUF2752)